MPTEETIGETFGVSRITVRQALDGLAQSGYIYKIQGKGSFVAAKKAGMQLTHLIGFSDAVVAGPGVFTVELGEVQIGYARIKERDLTLVAIRCVAVEETRLQGLEHVTAGNVQISLKGQSRIN